MKLPGNKEIVVREREVIDEANLTDEQKEELNMKKAKKGLVKTIALATATFVGGVAAGVKGYQAYVSNKDDDAGFAEVSLPSDDEEPDNKEDNSEDKTE